MSSIPPAPLNRLARGLLDFFGIKAMGRNPQQLIESVMPTIDLLDWYAHTDALRVFWDRTDAGNVTGAGYNILDTTPTDIASLVTPLTLTVPQNEMWMIVEAHVMWNLGDPGASGQWGYLHGDNATLEVWPMVTNGWVTGAAAPANRRGSAVLTDTVFVPPGFTINAVCYGQVPGAVPVLTSGGFTLHRLLV